MTKALAVGRKELRQIARDRRTLLILVFVPAFFLLLYGYALNFDIRHVQLGVEDRDGTPESRADRVGLRQLGLLRSRRVVFDPEEAERLLDLQRSAGGAGDSRRLRPRRRQPGRPRPVQVIISGDNANTATTVMGYARQHPADRRRELAPRRRAACSRRSPSSRASGTTPSCAARCSWCPG